MGYWIWPKRHVLLQIHYVCEIHLVLPIDVSVFFIQGAILESKTKRCNTFGKMEKNIWTRNKWPWCFHMAYMVPRAVQDNWKRWQVSMVFTVENSQDIYNCIHRKPMKIVKTDSLFTCSGITLCIFFSVTIQATSLMNIPYTY